jgi:hypothetical protein
VHRAGVGTVVRAGAPDKGGRHEAILRRSRSPDDPEARGPA